MKNHLSPIFRQTPHSWNILISKSVGKLCPLQLQETDIFQALGKTIWLRGRLGAIGQRPKIFRGHLLYTELSFTKPWHELVCLEKFAAFGKQKNRVYFIIKTLRFFVNSWLDIEAAFLDLKWQMETPALWTLITDFTSYLLEYRNVWSKLIYVCRFLMYRTQRLFYDLSFLVFAIISNSVKISSDPSWIWRGKETCGNFKAKFQCLSYCCQGCFRSVFLKVNELLRCYLTNYR